MKETLTSNVKTKRTEKKLTQQDVAEAIGVSRQTVVAIEGGNYTPSVLLGLKLAELLDCRVEDLFIVS